MIKSRKRSFSQLYHSGRDTDSDSVTTVTNGRDTDSDGFTTVTNGSAS